MTPKNINLKVDPNRGGRFGHQFYEAGLLSAWAMHLNANLMFNKGFANNSSSFGNIFFPGELESEAGGVDEFVFLSNFSEADSFANFILNNPTFINRPKSRVLEIIGNFYESPWLYSYLHNILTPLAIHSGLLHIGAKLKCALYAHNLIDINLQNNIAIHIRRGDVSDRPELSNRFVSDDYYIDLIDRLVKFCKVRYESINIYSTPDFNFERLLEKHAVNLRVSLDEVHAFAEMASSYALIGAPSGFSYAAHICSGKPILVHNRDWNKYYSPLSFNDDSKFLDFIKLTYGSK